MKRISILTIAIFMALILVACGGEADSGSTSDTEIITTAEETIPTPTQETVEDDVPVDAQQVDEEQASEVPATDIPSTAIPATNVPPTEVEQTEAEVQTVAYVGEAWTQLPLTNVATGETFTFADFAGQTVFVHPMATWCSRCRENQRSLSSSVVPQVNPENVVFVSLSVEPFEDQDALAQYAENNGFTWLFAVVSGEMLPELISVFGNSVANPPTQPHFIINPDGTHAGLRTGGVNAMSLVTELQQAG